MYIYVSHLRCLIFFVLVFYKHIGALPLIVSETFCFNKKFINFIFYQRCVSTGTFVEIWLNNRFRGVALTHIFTCRTYGALNFIVLYSTDVSGLCPLLIKIEYKRCVSTEMFVEIWLNNRFRGVALTRIFTCRTYGALNLLSCYNLKTYWAFASNVIEESSINMM
jgi:hypothetical protein